MNKYVTILLIVLLAAVALVLIRQLFPTVKHFLRSPAGRLLMLILLVTAIITIILLVRSLRTTGGTTGNSGDTIGNEEQSVSDRNEKLSTKGCIVITGDELLIEGMSAGTDRLEAYLKDKAENNVTVILVDNYALTTLYRQAVKLCKQEGVHYVEKDETWLEE